MTSFVPLLCTLAFSFSAASSDSTCDSDAVEARARVKSPTLIQVRRAQHSAIAHLSDDLPEVGYEAVDVHGTMWADATDSGGCEMPMTEYSVHHAVALGDEQAMGLLSAQSSNHLCGQVVSVDCGGVAVEAVVASICNKNSGTCGVDMIRKTWSEATGGKTPGIEACSVVLKSTLPMKSNSLECFYRPSGELGNAWFASVGLFNTGGKLPVSATLNGVEGAYNGDSAYFDFNGYVGLPTDSNTDLITTFADGTSVSVPFSQCIEVVEAYIWSSESTSSPASTPASPAPPLTDPASTTEPSLVSTAAPTPAPTPLPVSGDSCGGAWEQCGGRTWTGAACCLEDYECKKQHEYYSQCLPRLATADLTSDPPLDSTATPTSAPTPVSGSGDSCGGAWEQCGGRTWTGATCCLEDYECKKQHEYYSQCLPRPTAGLTSDPPLDSTATTTSASTPVSESGGSCSGAWEQCGGRTWTGATCCLEDYDCKKQHEYYSQCLPRT